MLGEMSEFSEIAKLLGNNHLGRILPTKDRNNDRATADNTLRNSSKRELIRRAHLKMID